MDNVGDGVPMDETPSALFAADSRVEQGVCTFTPPSLKGGPETEVRFDATYCSKAPEPVRTQLSTPAGLAAALLDHNDLRNFAPSEQHKKCSTSTRARDALVYVMLHGSRRSTCT